MKLCERCGESIPKGHACTCPPTPEQSALCEFCGAESQYCWCFDLHNAYLLTSHAQVTAFMQEVFPARQRSWSRLYAKKVIRKA